MRPALPLLALIGLALPATTGAQGAFVEGPYVDRLVPGGATVHARLRSPAPADAHFEFAGGTLDRHGDVATSHRFLVSGLPDDAVVRYTVTAGGVSASGSFHTAPAAPTRPIRFLALGDCRDGDVEHARVLASVDFEPDFLLHLGDMVPMGRSEAEWTRFLNVAKPMLRKTAIVPVLGNHELIGSAGPAMYRDRFALPREPAAYYTFDFAGVRVIVLDSNDDLEAGSPQHAFAKRELERATANPPRRLFVAIHHGPLSSGRHGGFAELHDSGLVASMRRAHVDLVLSGHDHMYERGELDGLKYVVTGGCGSPLYDANSREAYQRKFEATYHHLRVDVTDDSLSILARRMDGSVIESCTTSAGGSFRCEVPPPPSGASLEPADSSASTYGDEEETEDAPVPYGTVAGVTLALLAAIAFVVFRRRES